jgi:hypothetical protein
VGTPIAYGIVVREASQNGIPNPSGVGIQIQSTGSGAGAGFGNGINFLSQAVLSTGALLRASGSGSPSYDRGIDFTGVTFPTAAIKIPVCGTAGVQSWGVLVTAEGADEAVGAAFQVNTAGAGQRVGYGLVLNGNSVKTALVKAGSGAAPVNGIDLSSATFSGDAMILPDGGHIRLGTGAGTQIGRDASQKIGVWGATPVARPTVTGSRGGNAALASLLTQLATVGLIVDSSSA